MWSLCSCYEKNLCHAHKIDSDRLTRPWDPSGRTLDPRGWEWEAKRRFCLNLKGLGVSGVRVWGWRSLSEQCARHTQELALADAPILSRFRYPRSQAIHAGHNVLRQTSGTPSQA